jgi:hypothetical protein
MKKILLLLYVLSLLSGKSKKTIVTEVRQEKSMVVLIPSEINASNKK